MSYPRGSAEAERETRHAALMGEIMNVVNKYSGQGMPGHQQVEIMNCDVVEVSTYYNSLENGKGVVNKITHRITVETTSTAETEA